MYETKQKEILLLLYEVNVSVLSAFCQKAGHYNNQVWRNLMFNSGDGFNLKETGWDNFFQLSACF